MKNSSRIAWARNREALGRALDVALPPLPAPWTMRSSALVLEELSAGPLGAASPVPVQLWVVRQRVPLVYLCINHLLVFAGDERFIALPPGDDPRLPALRCPPLDGSCPLPALGTGEGRAARLSSLQARGLFEPVPLGPWVQGLLWRRRRGPPPPADEAGALVSVLLALRFWEPTGSAQLQLGTTYATLEEVPAQTRAALHLARQRTAGDGVVETMLPSGVDMDARVQCHPGRLRALEDPERPRSWIETYLMDRVAHDSQAGGDTQRLWHCTLDVTAEGWRLERSLLWIREVEGIELS